MLSSYLQHFCFQMTNALQNASEITPPYYTVHVLSKSDVWIILVKLYTLHYYYMSR